MLCMGMASSIGHITLDCLFLEFFCRSEEHLLSAVIPKGTIYGFLLVKKWFHNTLHFSTIENCGV